MADYILDDSEEAINIIEDFFCAIQDKFEFKNVNWYKRKVIMSDRAIGIYRRNSKDPNKCSIKERQKHFKKSSVSNLQYRRMIANNSPQLKKYSIAAMADIIHVEIKNVSNPLYDHLKLLKEINLIINRLKRFFDRKFKLMFFDNQSESNEFISFSLVSLK